jgi:hypothetical protein
MYAYVFQAALWCEECGAEIRQEIEEEGNCPKHPDNEHTYDSDEYPKGPYGDGGGEADCPQHCDGCSTFLENPLTSDGYEYVKAALTEHNESGRGNANVLRKWANFYELNW